MLYLLVSWLKDIKVGPSIKSCKLEIPLAVIPGSTWHDGGRNESLIILWSEKNKFTKEI